MMYPNYLVWRLSVSIRYEVECDICLEQWDADDESTAQYDLESHLMNDHWGTITEVIDND